jgi:hypothetical protein
MDDPNKLRHGFGNPDHNLDALVQVCGSEEAAGRAIVEAVNQAYRDGSLVVDTLDRYTQVFEVGGYLVTVRGKIVNGVVRVGSAWIRPSANGDHDA